MASINLDLSVVVSLIAIGSSVFSALGVLFKMGQSHARMEASITAVSSKIEHNQQVIATANDSVSRRLDKIEKKVDSLDGSHNEILRIRENVIRFEVAVADLQRASGAWHDAFTTRLSSLEQGCTRNTEAIVPIREQMAEWQRVAPERVAAVNKALESTTRIESVTHRLTALETRVDACEDKHH